MSCAAIFLSRLFAPSIGAISSFLFEIVSSNRHVGVWCTRVISADDSIAHRSRSTHQIQTSHCWSWRRHWREAAKTQQNFSSKKLAAWHLANTRISKFLASPSLPLGLSRLPRCKNTPTTITLAGEKTRGNFPGKSEGCHHHPIANGKCPACKNYPYPRFSDPCPTKLVELKIIPIWWEKYQ